MNTQKIIENVPEYNSFMTLSELDKRAFEVSKKYGFAIEEVGKSSEGRSIYMIRAGKGKKNAFLWGFPHPNEPIGSMTIDFIINYLGNNLKDLDDSGYTWYFIYTMDPDGTLLNEGWFKGNLTIKKYFLDYYRPPADRMIDWTFPVEYKDFVWNQPMTETKILMNIINRIKPDLMYPLHNFGFGGAYFFSTKKFENSYYDNILKMVEKLELPLHMGEPEEEFMKEIRKPFYFDFSFKDYYEQQLKLGNDPKKMLKHGDNSTGYLMRNNSNSIVIKGEIPYFYDKAILDVTLSQKTRREIWTSYLDVADKNLEIYRKIVPLVLNNLHEPDPYYYLTKLIERRLSSGNDSFRKHVSSSLDYDRKATNAEVFDCDIGGKFGMGLSLGQLRRAALRAKLDNKVIKEIENKIDFYSEYINKHSEWEVLPIKKLVQLQVLVLIETLNHL